MEYDVVFPSIFVNSFKLVFKGKVSSFATHCFALCLDFSFRSMVCASDSSLLSACVKKNCISSATSEDEVVTSIGVVWISSSILGRIFSVTLSSSVESKSPAMWLNQQVVLFWKWIATQIHLHSRVLAELLLFGKNVWRICCLSEQLLALLPLTKYMQAREIPCRLPKKSFEYMDNLSCAGEIIFEPNATGAYTFRFDSISWSGLSSTMKAYPALLKLVSVIRTSCFPGMSCFSANWQASLRAFLTEWNVSFKSDVILIGTSSSRKL